MTGWPSHCRTDRARSIVIAARFIVHRIIGSTQEIRFFAGESYFPLTRQRWIGLTVQGEKLGYPASVLLEPSTVTVGLCLSRRLNSSLHGASPFFDA